MAIPLKVSTAGQEIPLGPFLDSTDGNTEETALTITSADIKLWKNATGSLVTKQLGGATHMANGVYITTLDATDTNTLGPMMVYCHPTGALFTRIECMVYTSSEYEWVVNGDPTFVASAVWTAVRASYQTSGTFGEVTELPRFVSAMFNTSGGTFATAVTGSPVYEITNNAGAGNNTAVLAAISVVSVAISVLGTQVSTVSAAVSGVSAAISAVASATTQIMVLVSTVSAAVSTVGAQVSTVSVAASTIRAKTNQLIFTKTNELDVNVRSMNSITITGDGSATPFGVD